jgi:hypothetical protein
MTGRVHPRLTRLAETPTIAAILLAKVAVVAGSALGRPCCAAERALGSTEVESGAGAPPCRLAAGWFTKALSADRLKLGPADNTKHVVDVSPT